MNTKTLSTHQCLVLLSNALLFMLKVSIAASVDMKVFIARLRVRKRGMVVGVVCQYVFLPLCGFGIAQALNLESIYGISLMVMMSSPGGSFSNWWCSLFNVDLAMSVAMTGASVLVGVVMLPVNVYFYCWLLYGESTFTRDQVLAVLLSLAVIFVALVVGLCVSYFLDSAKARDCFYMIGNFVGLVLFIVSFFISGQSKKPVWKEHLWLHAAIASPIIAAIVLTTLVSSMRILKLKKPERVAVVIEACYQNPGLASSIVIGMFAEAQAADAIAVPILYGIYEAVLLAIFCVIAHYANWTFVSRTEVSIIQAIRGNYQERAVVDAPYATSECASLSHSFDTQT
jgi:predicted Na+-dependent transporter